MAVTKERLQSLADEALARIEAASSADELEDVRRSVLGRKGELAGLMRGIGSLPPDERGAFGRAVNEVKGRIDERLEAREAAFLDARLDAALADERFDPTEPPIPPGPRGHLHPITAMRREIERVFMRMGFSVVDGPEVESERYNFDLLNIPAHHPARDAQDTFWLESGHVLRTHTSPVQLRALQRAGGVPPVRVIAPGRVFRNEAPDATHEHTFHQVEGLMVDEGVSVADMKGVLAVALGALFGRSVEVRLRPHYFPFVEPGFELDMRWVDKAGEAEWLEMLGCGLVHPEVLRHGGMDPARVSGFAFGMGLDRLAMMREGIEDVRWMMSGDLRFLEQF